MHICRDDVQITVNGVLDDFLVVGCVAIEQVGCAAGIRHYADILAGVTLRVAVYQQHALSIISRQNACEVYCGDGLADAAL